MAITHFASIRLPTNSHRLYRQWPPETGGGGGAPFGCVRVAGARHDQDADASPKLPPDRALSSGRTTPLDVVKTQLQCQVVYVSVIF